MAIGFSEINRARRERNAFKNLVEYAQAVDIPDPGKAAEQAAAQIHGGRARASSPARKPRPNVAPKPQEKPAAKKKAAPKATKPAKSAKSETAEAPRKLEDRTKEQLYSRAQELEIEGRSQMSKDELIEAIRKK